MIDIQYFVDLYNEFPFLVQLVWIVIGLMFLAIILLTMYLKVIRYYLRKKDIEFTKFKNEYEALLVEYLYADKESEEFNIEQQSIILKIKSHILFKNKRKRIISVLYKLMNEVSGEMADSIKTLYYETGLIDYALKRLNNKNWYVIAKGIGELTRFKIEEVYVDIVKFIDHPRKEVRKETQLYLVSLFRFEGLSFLNELKEPLSEWAQVQLLEILQKFDDQQICDIQPWLKSKNDTVVLFALKLAQIYNQFEVKDTLTDLLSHQNKSIRIYVIEVLTHLYGIEAKDKLKANFNDLSIEEQISFFGLLEKLVIPSDEPFIEKHLFHKNFEIQLLALKILKSINIDKFIGLNNLPKHKKSSAMLKMVNTD
jgi:hypothetical protein